MVFWLSFVICRRDKQVWCYGRVLLKSAVDIMLTDMTDLAKSVNTDTDLYHSFGFDCCITRLTLMEVS